jgi:hypothetical protein
VTPEDERWLRQVVGLSDILIGQLRVWAGAREAAGSHAGSNAMSALDAQADALVAALNAELQLRFKVEHLH